MTFEVTSNHNGYLYVLHRDPKNKFFVLYPRSGKKNRANKIVANKVFKFPSGGKFKFSPPKGIEYLSFVLASKPIFSKQLRINASRYGFPALSQEDRSASMNTVTTTNNQRTTTGNIVTGNTGTVSNVNVNVSRSQCTAVQVLLNTKSPVTGKTKTLVFEADSEQEEQASYYVLPKQDLASQEASLIFIPFFLVHR